MNGRKNRLRLVALAGSLLALTSCSSSFSASEVEKLMEECPEENFANSAGSGFEMCYYIVGIAEVDVNERGHSAECLRKVLREAFATPVEEYPHDNVGPNAMVLFLELHLEYNCSGDQD